MLCGAGQVPGPGGPDISVRGSACGWCLVEAGQVEKGFSLSNLEAGSPECSPWLYYLLRACLAPRAFPFALGRSSSSSRLGFRGN